MGGACIIMGGQIKNLLGIAKLCGRSPYLTVILYHIWKHALMVEWHALVRQSGSTAVRQ